MKNAQIQSFIDKVKNDLSTPSFPVDGFNFHLDSPKKFNPYTLEASTISGFPHQEGMPDIEGFFYLSEEYGDYLETLKESQTQHPANIDNLQWIDNDNLPLETV